MFKTVLKLRSNHILQHLGQEREVGVRSVAGKNIWVILIWMTKGADDCNLEGRWNTTGLKGAFDSVGDEGAENGYDDLSRVVGMESMAQV